MKSTIIRYLVIVWGVAIAAANFIACGTQMYQVSIHKDVDDKHVAKDNPDVNNPNSTLYGIHAVSGWRELPIRYRFGPELSLEQRKHLRAAMSIWEAAVGRQLFVFVGVHKDTTGDSFKDLYSSLDDNINGYYMDENWAKTQKPDEVLATTIWSKDPKSAAIATADIRYNMHDYIIGDSLLREATDTKEVVDMQSVSLHELGHMLGLAHVDPSVDKYSIMNPTIFIGHGLTSRELSKGDLERIQTIYGCQNDSCDADKTLKNIAQLHKQPLKDPLDEAGAMAH